VVAGRDPTVSTPATTGRDGEGGPAPPGNGGGQRGWGPRVGHRWVSSSQSRASGWPPSSVFASVGTPVLDREVPIAPGVRPSLVLLQIVIGGSARWLSRGVAARRSHVRFRSRVGANSMATRTTTSLVDDLDGSTAEETVPFGLDGVDYEIDLSADHAEILREVLARYAASARRTGGRRAGADHSRAPRRVQPPRLGRLGRGAAMRRSGNGPPRTVSPWPSGDRSPAWSSRPSRPRMPRGCRARMARRRLPRPRRPPPTPPESPRHERCLRTRRRVGVGVTA
jgi:hypothetical protein